MRFEASCHELGVFLGCYITEWRRKTFALGNSQGTTVWLKLFAILANFGNPARHDHDPALPPPDSPLIAAAAFIRASLLADGSDAGGGSEFDAPERQWQALREWAEAGQLILPADFPGPVRTGTREHDVRFDESRGLWWKFTKADLAGYTVDWNSAGQPFLLNALPEQYLDRLALQNAEFADDIRFQGLWRDPAGGWRIVTSQPDISGSPASLDEIESGMIALGFELLPWTGIGYHHALAFRGEHVVVWDAHPANMVMTADGELVPIDVIITRLDEHLSG